MEPADSIARIGFPSWYERQLLQGHAYLVTCILCIVLVATAFELGGAGASRMERVLLGAFVLGAVVLGIYSLRRYRAILLRAQALAQCATCKTCQTYGRIQVLDSGSTGGEAPDEERAPWLKVRCKKCGHAWTMG